MRHILIVEDNEADQYLHEIVINKNQPEITVSKVSDGAEALEFIKDAKILPDLILLDINMPRLNGHEFLSEFASNYKSEIPVVIMLTSSDQGNDKEKAMQHSCVKDYLVKPLKDEDVPKLITLVDEIIEKNKQGA